MIAGGRRVSQGTRRGTADRTVAHLSTAPAHGHRSAVPTLPSDLLRLAALEQRLGRPPHAVLAVPTHASIAEICEAFAEHVHACDAARFREDPLAVARARRAMRHLRTAFRAAIGRELAPRVADTLPPPRPQLA